MKYLSLRLEGYKRMLLNNIKVFEINPTEPIQLILGTNGSGKSSLLHELTPLPALMSDYAAEGSKSIAIEHLGAVYDLTSTFSNGQKHSFVKNHKELNDGRTLAVQKELVKQEFGVTDEIRNLTTGTIKFSAMGPSDRRYWLTKLSDQNYDYAIAYYNKLKEKARDISGSLKTTKHRLVTEISKIIGDEEREGLQKQVDDLHELLQHMLEYRKPQDKRPEEYSAMADTINKKIVSLFGTLIRKKQTHQGRGLSLEVVAEKLVQLEAERVVENTWVSKFFEEHTKLQEKIDALQATGGEGSDALRMRIRGYNDDLYAKLKQRKMGLEIADPLNVQAAFEAVYDTLTTVFSTLPENKTRTFSKNSLLDTAEKINRLRMKNEHDVSNLNKLTVSKQNQEHQKTHDLLTCPKCDHTWAKGFDQDYYDQLTVNIETVQAEIDETTMALQELETFKADIVTYSETYRQFSNCVTGWSILHPLWNKITETDMVASSPRSVLALLDTFKYDLTIDIEAEAIRKEITRTEELLILSNKVGEEDVNRLIVIMAELEKKIEISTARQQEVNMEIRDLTTYKRDMEDILTLADDIQLLSANFQQCYTETIDSLRRGVLIEAIKSVQIALSNKEKLLSEVKQQAAVIASLKEQIAGYEKDDGVYKLLLKELSPTDGLIAEGLLGFISSFVQQMNSFIKKIWMYPLQIIPCGVSEDGQIDLDYKFPLNIQDDANRVSDVSKGSSAMKEVVDLAFKLTAMKSLGLAESPLILDEFGASLDSEHRIAANRTIQELMDMNCFSQLYIVSHYEATYGSLTNAQVCVLCSNNIVIPRGALVNQHVKQE